MTYSSDFGAHPYVTDNASCLAKGLHAKKLFTLLIDFVC
jgi:hypothetical protein